MCKHKTCHQGVEIKGVGAILLNHYSKGSTHVKYAALFGKERGGKYQGYFNIFGGSMNHEDHKCALSAIIRELKEEAKIDLSDWGRFDSVFKSSTGIRYFMINNTMIFVGVLSPGFSRGPIKRHMISDCVSHPLPEYREMDDAEWFDAATDSQIEHKSCHLSSYAKTALSLLRSKKMCGL